MTRPEDHRLVDLLYGELSEEEERAYRRELESDPEQLREAESLSDVLQAVRSVEDEEPSSHLDALILARAREEATAVTEQRSQAGPAGWLRRVFRLPIPAIAAAGMAILATLFILPLAKRAVEGPAALEPPPIMSPEATTAAAPEEPVADREAQQKPATIVSADELFEGEAPDEEVADPQRALALRAGKGAKTGRRTSASRAAPAQDEPAVEGAQGDFGASVARKKDAVQSRREAKKRKRRRARRPPAPEDKELPAPPPPPARAEAPAKSAEEKAERRVATELQATPEQVQPVPSDGPSVPLGAVQPAKPTRAPAPTVEDDGFRAGGEDLSKQTRGPAKRPAPSTPKAQADGAASAAARGAEAVGDADDALPDRTERSRQAAELAASFIRAAEAELVRKDVDAARRILRRGQTRTRGTPSYGTVTLRLARLELQQKRYAEAARLAESASRVPGFQQRAQARALLARARLALERRRSQESESVRPAEAQ